MDNVYLISLHISAQLSVSIVYVTLKKTNRREPEERSLRSTNEYFMERFDIIKPGQKDTSTYITHSHHHQSPSQWHPSSLYATIPTNPTDTPLIEKKCTSVVDEIHSNENAKLNMLLKSRSIPQAQPPSMQPELSSLGSTATKVEGSEKWQKSRARLRRPESCKPVALLEVLCNNGRDWIPATLEVELEASRRYTLLDGSNRSEEIEYGETHHRVRKFGTNPKQSRAFCFLCGREAGLYSLHFHFQKCLLKWDRRISLPFTDGIGMELFDQRSLPSKPGKELDLYNERALFIFREYIKPKCPGCAKNFMLDCLIGHVKVGFWMLILHSYHNLNVCY